MAKDNKKQHNNQPRKPITNDPRFAHVHHDPRFARNKKKDVKVKVDERFSAMLKSKEFNDRPKVDRYGRKVEQDASEQLRRFYEFEEAESDDDDDNKSVTELEKEIEADEANWEDEKIESQPAKRRAGGRGTYDPMRGRGIIDSEDDTSDEEEREMFSSSESEEEEKIPESEPTYRFAVVNMDWDNLKAMDILKVLNTFKPPQSVIKSVAIYPSQFGKERLAREETEGPPREIFENGNEKKEKEKDEEEKDEEDEDETEEDFDQEALRKYQLERLRYYYAVVECDSKETAEVIYKACDGSEYESSANFFDLRYIPDTMTFDDDEPREVATSAPEDYKPTVFMTDALRNTRVKLTWDADDHDRIETMRRNFTEDDINDQNFDAYIASSDDDDSEEEDLETLREKYRKLLENGGESAFDGHDHDEEGDMEVTFAPGLTEAAEEAVNKRLHGGDVAEKEETTIEKYMRKQREKRKLKKERRLAKSEEGEDEAPESEADEELANDPYFKEAMEEMEGQVEEKPKSKEKKSKNKKNKLTKEERKKKEQERAELELLMDDKKGEGFNMRDVIKKEKAEKRKGKKGKKMANLDGAQEDFEIDVNDPRFAALHESHHFAIDPTNPQFKKTKSMQKLLTSRQETMRKDSATDGEWKKEAVSVSAKAIL
ncbi:hypothetical protein BX666DRAFT_1988849 [Dichotomocladium elegans]|nr:hypothetical protein BX666DRAFT_1988849 [Dichotomocladium elegans]